MGIISTESFTADGTQKTFTVSQDILSASHCRVDFYYLAEGDEVADDHEVTGTNWDLLGLSTVVFNDAPTSEYVVKVTISSDGSGLDAAPSEISDISANIDDIRLLADNIDLFKDGLDKTFIASDLPTSGVDGDISVNVLDGGIYEWQSGDWVLVAQSAGGSDSEANDIPIVGLVDGLPESGKEGELVFNSIDGFYYAFMSGTWEQFTSPVPDIAGILVVPTTTGLNGVDGDVVFASDTKKLMEYTAGAWSEVISPTGVATEVADGAITTAKFAAGLKPVEIVDVLPTLDLVVGRMAYLTTDGKLYRYTAAGWSAEVAAQDLTGTIGVTKIADGAISTEKLAVGAVTADTIAANAIVAGKISANAVTAGTIVAGAIGATEIAANAITATKIAAGAITAGKIAANAITAGTIAANSITSDKILANSIIAGKIAVGAVGANQITANAINAGHIASGSITATKIGAYAIDATKLSAGAIYAQKFLIDTNNTPDAASGKLLSVIDRRTGNYRNSVSIDMTGSGINTYAFHSKNYNGTGNARGILGSSSGSSSGVGVAGWCSAIGRAGIHGYRPSDSGSIVPSAACAISGDGGTKIGVLGKGAHAVRGIANNANGWGLITYDRAHIAGGVFSFTGSHIGFTNETPTVGDILVVEDVYSTSINQSYPLASTSIKVKDKTVIGVASFCEGKPTKDFLEGVDSNLMNKVTTQHLNNDDRAGEVGSKSETVSFDGFKDEHIEFVNKVITMNNVSINSIGEGMINVCSEGGNIDNGDYICSSNTAGKGMKQDDDILHNYTVAKALESVDWSTETSTVKMIACTYHCG